MGCRPLKYHQLTEYQNGNNSFFPKTEIVKSGVSDSKIDLKSFSYGFNGMEKDDEVYGGKGNSYSTEFRSYSPRLGRWLSMDPVLHHHLNPYNGFDNNPIYFKDPRGSNSEGGPGDRAINKDINPGVEGSDPTKAGSTEILASGATVYYADVSLNDAGEKNSSTHSNAYRIAKDAGISLEELYAMNPGLEANKNEIGQGQMIFTSNEIDWGITNGPAQATTDTPGAEAMDEQSASQSREKSWIDILAEWERNNGTDPDIEGNSHGTYAENEDPYNMGKFSDPRKSLDDGWYYRPPKKSGKSVPKIVNIEIVEFAKIENYKFSVDAAPGWEAYKTVIYSGSKITYDDGNIDTVAHKLKSTILTVAKVGENNPANYKVGDTLNVTNHK